MFVFADYSVWVDVGLIATFVLILGLAAQGLIAYAIAQVFAERAENKRLLARRPGGPAQVGPQGRNR